MITLIFLTAVVLIATAIWCTNKYTKMKDAKDLQHSIDRNVEQQLMDGLESLTIATLAKHSDKNRIASIVSSRISDYLKMGVDPETLYKVFQNLALYPGRRENWNTTEVELSAVIQQYVLQNNNSRDLSLWNTVVLGDKKKGFEKLQNSFLVKVPKDMLVWSPFN